MAKKATAKRIAQFLHDLQTLRERHGNDAVAKKTKIHPANLSSYIRGLKIPGEITINRFYMNVEDELNQPNYPNGSDQSNQSKEPKQPKEYPTGSLENLVEEPGVVRSFPPFASDASSDLLNFLRWSIEQQSNEKKLLWKDKELLEKDKDHLRDENKWMREKFDAVLANNTTMANAVETIANKFDPPKA